MILGCPKITYRVLSVVSNGYPRLKDRLPTCYSPVRHGIATIRLACIRHAASVNPEPGSNSPKKFYFLEFNSFAQFLIELLLFLTLRLFRHIQFSKTQLLVRRAV